MTSSFTSADSVSRYAPLAASATASVCAIRVPAWVDSLLPDAHATRLTFGADPVISAKKREAPHAALVSVLLPGARRLAGAELRMLTRRVYETHRQIAGEAWHPVRVWNFIPGITERMADDSDASLDRYMAFNLGRHDAVGDWFGHDDAGRLPTASGVGHAGDDLEVHMLLRREKPISIENPRQCPAFTYSTRFGPKPPCFSRASLVPLGDEPTLLIAGTASILGEDSLHTGLIREQIEETFANLSALIASAGDSVNARPSDPIGRFENVRAYSPDPAHDRVIAEELHERLGGRGFEIVRADLCRSELLVEIEGTARLGERSGAAR